MGPYIGGFATNMGLPTSATDFQEYYKELKHQKDGAVDTVLISKRDINFELDLDQVNCYRVVFRNVHFKENFRFANAKRSFSKLSFEDCQFDGFLSVTDLECDLLTFTNCIVGVAFITQVIGSQGAFFTNCSSKNVYMDDCNYHQLRIGDCQNFSLELSKSTVGTIEIVNNRENVNLDFISAADLPIKVVVNAVQMRFLPIQTGSISFTDLEIQRLEMEGVVEKAVIDFSFITVQTILFNRLINHGALKFSTIYFLPNSGIEIYSSDLGKAVVFGIDFGEISTFCLQTTNLNDLVCSGVKWCKSIEVDPRNQMSFAELREAYKQVKNITSKQNDKPEELRFFGLEMESYRKQIAEIPKHGNDRFILSFSKWTNDYGQSWTRPLIIISLSVLAFYPVIKVLLGFTQFAPKYWLLNLSELIEAINPARKFADSYGLDGHVKDNWQYSFAKILDAGLRVWIGLLLFQMVRAFRKYVR